MIIGYTDKKGRLIFVAEGLSAGIWGTFCKGPGRWAADAIHRVKSRALPMRSSKTQAEEDLRKYAKTHKLMLVDFTT